MGGGISPALTRLASLHRTQCAVVGSLLDAQTGRDWGRRNKPGSNQAGLSSQNTVCRSREFVGFPD